MTTQPLLNGVLEEKMARIAEVLLGSVPPFQLMLGKLLGYVGVAVTLVAVYLVGGFIVADYFGYADIIPAHLLVWFMVYQCLAILMFGSMFLAIGACCNDIREAQNLMLPVWLILCIPLLTLQLVIEHPDSLFSVLLSLFPPATPLVMVPRMAIPPGAPLWQPVVGVVGTLITTALCVWVSGRIFRIGLLLQGKPPKIREMIRWAVRG
jgi:ABC-2 type transport system permease protein